MGIYVLQVNTGNEFHIKEMLEQPELGLVPALASRFFIPQKSLNHRNNAEERSVSGERISRRKAILFPGYLFLESEQIEPLRVALRRFWALGFIRLIGREEDSVLEVTPEEMQHIRRLSGDDPSFGFVEGGKVRITSGSLAGMESFIRKVDRRKGNVLLEMDMFGRKLSFWIACDLTEHVKE